MRINPVADIGEESLENDCKRLDKQHYRWLDKCEDEMDYSLYFQVYLTTRSFKTIKL